MSNEASKPIGYITMHAIDILRVLSNAPMSAFKSVDVSVFPTSREVCVPIYADTPPNLPLITTPDPIANESAAKRLLDDIDAGRSFVIEREASGTVYATDEQMICIRFKDPQGRRITMWKTARDLGE